MHLCTNEIELATHASKHHCIAYAPSSTSSDEEFWFEGLCTVGVVSPEPDRTLAQLESGYLDVNSHHLNSSSTKYFLPPISWVHINDALDWSDDDEIGIGTSKAILANLVLEMTDPASLSGAQIEEQSAFSDFICRPGYEGDLVDSFFGFPAEHGKLIGTTSMCEAFKSVPRLLLQCEKQPSPQVIFDALWSYSQWAESIWSTLILSRSFSIEGNSAIDSYQTDAIDVSNWSIDDKTKTIVQAHVVHFQTAVSSIDAESMRIKLHVLRSLLDEQYANSRADLLLNAYSPKGIRLPSLIQRGWFDINKVAIECFSSSEVTSTSLASSICQSFGLSKELVEMLKSRDIVF